MAATLSPDVDQHPLAHWLRYVGVFSYAGMSHAEAERSMRLFARTVLPELQHLGTQARVTTPATTAPAS